MFTDYEAVVKVLAEEVEYAKQMNCVMEDPYGETSEQSITDISFHILRRNSIDYEFIDSYLNNIDTDCDTTMMILIWIGKGQKVVKTQMNYAEMPMSPEGLKIFIRRQLYWQINTCVRNFFGANVQSTKYAVKSTDDVEVSIKKITSFSDVTLEPLLFEKISKLCKELYKMERVKSTNAVLSRAETINIVVDSEGRKIIDSNTEIVLSVNADLFNKQSFVIPINESISASDELRLIKQLRSLRASLIAKINNHQEIGFLKSSDYLMLFTSASSHTLFHEALVGHLFSGDYIVDQQSTLFQSQYGQDLSESADGYEVLKDLTVIVDPTKLGNYGGYIFDHEGIRAQRTVLCDRGVLKNYLLSRNSAARLSLKSNGHARAESYAMPNLVGGLTAVHPEARISHLIIDSHKGLSDKELIKKIGQHSAHTKQKHDFYLEISSHDGFVDPETTSFTLQFSSCRKVYFDGRVEVVNGGTVSGTPPELLSSIKAVGKKNYYDSGLCGSDSGYIPVSSETPKLFLAAHFVPAAKPEPSRYFDLVRDKYIPKNF